MSHPLAPRKEIADADLFASARRGDRRSLGALLERHRPRLHAVALSFLGDCAEAQDAVHDTFVTALLRLDAIRDPAAVGSWLQATVRSRCLMELRARRSRTRSHVELARRPRAVSPVDEQLERNALRDWLWTALGALPEPLRLTVTLRYFGSYSSYEELSAILAVPVGTVRSRLFEAKHRLGEMLLDGVADRDADEWARNAERRLFFTEAFRQLYVGRPTTFLSHFSQDLRIVWSNGSSVRGRSHLAAELEGDLRAGVRFQPRRVLASRGVAVVEGEFENPPEDPDHCPAGAAMVFFGDGETLRRLHLHLASRPPMDDA